MNPEPATGEHAVEDLLALGEAHVRRTDDAARHSVVGVPDLLRRISADVARLRVGSYTPPQWWAEHARDRLTLDALARSAFASPAALARIAGFASGDQEDARAAIGAPALAREAVDAEIEGFRLFGCLLHLTGHPVSARFWWQLAAGADDRLAAFCVYLQHLQRGELHEAQWWLQEASRADAELDPDGAAPAPELPAMPGYFRAVPAMLAPCPVPQTVRPSAALAEEVDRLVVRTGPEDPADDIDGIAGRPGPRLATHLRELVGHSG